MVYQQLAGRAASAIHARLVEAAGGEVTPGTVAAMGPEGLRSVGLSGAKSATILGTAEAVSSGLVDLEALGSWGDEEVVELLCRLKGIGPWTAQMFCMFELGRLDVWPVGDYGVRKGYAVSHQLEEPPSPPELARLGEAYRPYRSIAAWYLWRAVEAEPPLWGSPS